jgi:arylsulfatase A-like enzyme
MTSKTLSTVMGSKTLMQKNLKLQSFRGCVYLSAVYGATAWIIYAIVESFFLSILSWLVKPSTEYIKLHWGFTALSFLLYPTIGSIMSVLCALGLCIIGGKTNLIKNTQPAVLFSTVATLTIILAYAINILAYAINLIINYSGSLGLSELPPITISILFIFGLSLSVRSGTWFTRFRFLINPWTASILLVGLPWINKELLAGSSLAFRAGILLVYPVFIFLISYFLEKLMETHPVDKSLGVNFLSSRSIFIYATTVFFILGISFYLEQKPYVVATSSSSSPQMNDRPNIILIIMDTVRADHLSLYGYKKDTTPNLRKFSEEATLYDRAIAPSNWTLPTHASIFTGIYASKHRAYSYYDFGRPLVDEFHTIAEILSEGNYLTMGVVANHVYVTKSWGLAQGFQYYDQRKPAFFLGPTGLYYIIRQSIRNILAPLLPASYSERVYFRSEDINKKVFTQLEETKKKNKSFFLFINYMDAHIPYMPPSPFDDLFCCKDEKFRANHYEKIMSEVMKLERKITEKERNHLLSQYDGGIAYIDYHIGSLIRRLKELGLYENSLIIITSDHGEAFGERNLIGHGVSIYQDQVYVPLIVKYPNSKQRILVDEVVNVMDIFPTILDVAGGDEMSGKNQEKSLLKVEDGNPRVVISESFPYKENSSLHPRFRCIERAIFSRTFKFIRSTAGKRELYDLSKDPNEKKNLYDSDSNVSKELETRLTRWLASVESPGKEDGAPVQLKREILEALKTLGYIK